VKYDVILIGCCLMVRLAVEVLEEGKVARRVEEWKTQAEK
jgi:hypothetical protein